MERLRIAGMGLVVMAGAACVGTPSLGGVAGVAPSPNAAWTPPAREARTDTVERTAVPADLEQRIKQLSLAEVVDLGLRNNPQTRVSWANARAAAAAYGSERGAYFPTIDGDVTGTRLQTVASQGRSAVTQSVFSPSLSLSYLLFDFGGRSGTVGAARNSLLAANYTHNATLQDVVLQIQTAYFQYVANRALLQAQQITTREARTNLKRRKPAVGLALPRSPTSSRPARQPRRRSWQPRPRRVISRLPEARWRWRWDCPQTCRTTSTPPPVSHRSRCWPTAWMR